MSTKMLAAAALAVALSTLSSCAAVEGQAPRAVAATAPAFTYDTDWLKVPSQWVIGDISAVAVDRHDNVWILHRPRTIPADRRSKAAPPVMAFDSTGKFLRAWGGDGQGYDWPSNEHSLFVDDLDRVWLAGSSRAAGAGDHMILAFTTDGGFIRQIGKRNASKGDRDTDNLNAPADLFVDTARKELYAADGYGNRRVIVFDTETGKFKRMWGAFGDAPPSTPMGPAMPATKPAGAPDETGPGPREFRSVHGVEVARDGLVYVSDRDNRRVQVFDRDGKYRNEVFIHRNHPSRQTSGGLAFSADRGQKWLYVIDFGNAQIVAVDRKTLQPVADIGGPGKGPGQFTGPHLMASDSKGVIYVAEVQGGRVQRLIPAR